MTKICITSICPFCGGLSQVLVNGEDYKKYSEGEMVQNCFPYLNATEREVIISGICPTCQNDIFNEF